MSFFSHILYHLIFIKTKLGRKSYYAPFLFTDPFLFEFK